MAAILLPMIIYKIICESSKEEKIKKINISQFLINKKICCLLYVHHLAYFTYKYMHIFKINLQKYEE